jgi:hypothetical protein
MNQATTAIAAAMLPSDREWRPGSHGLRSGKPDPCWLSQTKVHSQPAQKKDQPNATDSFSMLCDALNTAPLTRSTAISNLWAAIPNLDVPGLGASCPRASHVRFDTGSPHAVHAVLRLEQAVAPGEAGIAQVRSMLERYYPAYAEGLIIEEVKDWPPIGSEVEIGWASPDGRRRDVRMHLTEYLGSYWLLPSLNELGETLPPLLLWWSLLYALSDLARYHPAEWAAELDPNQSKSAVSIEKALAIALAVVPRVILSTLVPSAYARP